MFNTNSNPQPAVQRGTLIVLEGLDRSGKSTQAAKLLAYLKSKGKSARIQRFPDRQEPCLGPAIDDFLKNAKNINQSAEFIHLLFSANRWALNERMRDEIAQGTTLILDRYSFSGVTYSMSKGLDPKWTAMPEVGLPRPDMVLFFDLDPEKTSQRSGFGDEILEQSEFQKLVYNNIKKIFNEKYWKTIDATHSVEKVHADVVEKVEELIRNVCTPLQSLTLADFAL